MEECYPLAIYTPIVGAASETFIQRHLNGLIPGKTMVFCDRIENFWKCEQPLRQIDQRKPAELNTVLDLLRKHQVKVIMGEYLNYSLVWGKIARMLGIKFYGHGHGYDVSSELRDQRCREQYREYCDADGVITINRISVERLVEVGIPRDKISLIHYGIVPPQLASRDVANDEVRVLAVGRMVEKKAPIVLLDAFRRALAECPAMHLDYVGDGKLLEAAQQAAKAFQIADKVTFYGSCTNDRVIALMTQADIFLQHSVTAANGDEEGLPVSILESLAYGLPVVSTRHAGIVDQVIEGSNGYLVDEFDSCGMGRYLAALAGDREMRVRFGRAGRMHFDANFTWDHERSRLLQTMGLAEFI